MQKECKKAYDVAVQDVPLGARYNVKSGIVGGDFFKVLGDILGDR